MNCSGMMGKQRQLIEGGAASLAPLKVIGRLTLIKRIPGSRQPRKDVQWEVECSCGTRKQVAQTELTRGSVKSCGCLQRELASARRKASAGKTPRAADHVLYAIWCAMRNRCNNPNYREYRLYGGRGIKVCEAWASFWTFAADMGERPPGMSLDRIDSDGNYEPGNCRWATATTQNNNRRNNNLITFRGETRTMAQWAETLGINYYTLATRLAEGWPVEEAFCRPVGGARRSQNINGATA